MRKIKYFVLGTLLIFCFASLIACNKESDKMQKVRDLAFTVVSEDCLPEELLEKVSEAKAQEFKITFTKENYLYICIGYGEQKTGGYSITLNELYETQNAIYIDTNLIGPQPEDIKKEASSYPYIVVKTEMIDKTVVFK